MCIRDRPSSTLRLSLTAPYGIHGHDIVVHNTHANSGRGGVSLANAILREAYLALGLVVILLGSMWLATGSFPPMVVVESGSMMHDEEGSVGTIDPGDLVLVMNPDRKDVITFVEATDEGNENYGHESHGMPGDVIVYKKNGGSDTPVTVSYTHLTLPTKA